MGRKDDSKILSTESRTETIDIFLPYNKDYENKIPVTKKNDEILISEDENPANKTEYIRDFDNKAINASTTYESQKVENNTNVDDINRKDEIDNQRKDIVEEKLNLIEASNADGENENDNNLLINETCREVVNPLTSSNVTPLNET